MSDPVVSVLMPARDAGFLEEAVDTILAQSLTAFELIVVDDGLPHAARGFIDATAARDGRVRILRHDGPHGLASALNAGLALARAPLIARADADDRYHPDRLRRQVPVFAARPDLVALSCGHHRIDASGRRLLTHRPVTGGDVIRFRAMFSNSLLHPGTVFRRDAVLGAGGYDPRFWTAQDSDLWARLMARGGKVDNLTDPLVEWRRHDASVLARRGSGGRALSLQVSARLQDDYLGQHGDPADVAAAVDTWRSYSPLDDDTLARGQARLRRIMAVAQTRETSVVLRDYRRSIARALLRQARFAMGRHPMRAARLGQDALGWMAWSRPGSGRGLERTT